MSVPVESGKSMGGGGKGGAENSMNDLYKINQVWFQMLPTLSLVAKRTILVNQAQKSSYLGTNDTIRIVMNTGEYYTSMPSSYLVLQLGYNNPALYGNSKALIAQGNIMSLFEEVVYTSASGTEICREINKGLHHAVTYRYNYSQEYIDTIGQIQGAPTGKYHQIHDGVSPVRGRYGYFAGNGTTTRYDFSLSAMYPSLGGYDGLVLPRSGSAAKAHWGYGCTNLNVCASSANVDAWSATGPVYKGTPRPASTAGTLPIFCIPLDQVLGLFKPYMNCLFPAGALAGGILELRFKRARESMQFIAAQPETTASTTTGDTELAQLITDCDNTLTVSQCYIAYDAFQMQDNVLKRLNQTAAGQDGLSLMFDTFDHVTQPFNGTGSVEAQVSQARSKVVRGFCVVRDTQAILCPYINSLASEGCVQRICAKVPRSSNIPTSSFLPTAATDLTNAAQLGPGGGLTYVTLLKASTLGAAGTTVTTNNIPSSMVFGPADTKNDGSSNVDGHTYPGIIGLLEEQPILPDDTYGADYGKPVISSFQSQLGSLFFPQQPLTTPEEYYQNALYIFGKGIPDKDITCSVSYEDFLGGLGYNWYGNSTYTNPTYGTSWRNWVAPYGLAVYGFLAEKSQALQLSGLPLANARLLRHKFTFAYNSPSTNRTISVFTIFTRIMKVFLGGRIVCRE